MDDLEHEKKIFFGDFAHKESIDISNSKYDAVKALLVSQGTKAQKWFREEFMASPDVVMMRSFNHREAGAWILPSPP